MRFGYHGHHPNFVLDALVPIVHRRLLMATLVSIPFAGCERIKKTEKLERLDQSLNAYVGAIRWGNFDTAAAFAAPRSGGFSRLNTATLVGIKVTGFGIRINEIDEKGEEANVTTSFTYYFLDNASVRHVDQTAVWYFDPPRRGWLMDDSLPDFSR